MYKNITLNDKQACYVHPYEAFHTCIDLSSNRKIEYPGSNRVFEVPNTSSFASMNNPEAITYLSTGLYTHSSVLFHLIREYDSGTDYLIAIDTAGKAPSGTYIDDLGIIGFDAATGYLYSVAINENPDDDITTIYMYSFVD